MTQPSLPSDPMDDRLRGELAELAGTARYDAYRPEQVRARVQRNRRRRLTARGVAGGFVVAATVAALVLVSDHASRGSVHVVAPAAVPTTVTTAASSSSTCAAAVIPKGASGVAQGVKGQGTVTAIDANSVSIKVLAPGRGSPDSITASFTSQTKYVKGDVPVTTRPTVAVGDTVVFGATRATATGPFQLDLFGTPAPADQPGARVPSAGTASGSISGSASGSASTKGSDEVVKGIGKVTAITPTSVTVTLGEPGPDGGSTVTASFTASTMYVDGDATVATRPNVAVGDTVVIGAVRQDGGPYEVITFGRPSAQDSVTGVPGEEGSKVEGQIVSVGNGTATMKVTGGQLPAGQTITLRLPDAGSAPKTDCGLANVIPGAQVGGLLGRPDATGAYPVIALAPVDAQVSKG
jgi:hypothetical protein